jgi:hypothetical protein
MTDIIERLRETADHEWIGHETMAVLREAAVEIERLRGEVHKLRDVLIWTDDNCPGKCAGPIRAVLVATARTP